MSLIKHMKLRIKLFKSIEIQVIKNVYKIWYIRNKERTFSIVINGSFNFCKTAKSKQSMKMCSIKPGAMSRAAFLLKIKSN